MTSPSNPDTPNGSTTTERRQFSRILFDGQTRLSQGAHEWNVILIDLCLKGLLIETPANWDANLAAPFNACISLGEEFAIRMTLQWRHTDNDQVGFEVKQIDIDSITHLRRLVELNTGDTRILEREVAALGR